MDNELNTAESIALPVEELTVITKTCENPEKILVSQQNTEITKEINDADKQSQCNTSAISVSHLETRGCSRVLLPESTKMPKVNLYAEDKGPRIYDPKGNYVTPPIIVKNLPEAYKFLPIHGRPETNKGFDEYFNEKLREFVGCDLSEEGFQQLADVCSPENLKNGDEISFQSNYPTSSFLPAVKTKPLLPENELCVVKKHKFRLQKDEANRFTKKLKYRGVRMMPLQREDDEPYSGIPGTELLDPGKDLLFRVRVYRPFSYNPKDRVMRGRHSLCTCEVVLTGRQRLSELRDRLVCANDVGVRYDVSNNPDEVLNSTSKWVFPSAFLFINNVFYVDTRAGCADRSAAVREWAARCGIGALPKQDMCSTRLDQLVVRLGHPEVYVHQGNCEHLFTFSEVRLLTSADALCLSQYPALTSISQLQTLYCSNCAEFSAKWIVTESCRVPFDPAFFCDVCFKMYLYKDGEKIGDFKAYCYKGNELNLLKPQA